MVRSNPLDMCMRICLCIVDARCVLGVCVSAWMCACAWERRGHENGRAMNFGLDHHRRGRPLRVLAVLHPSAAGGRYDGATGDTRVGAMFRFTEAASVNVFRFSGVGKENALNLHAHTHRSLRKRWMYNSFWCRVCMCACLRMDICSNNCEVGVLCISYGA